jgi:SagB-type dehydrogenase family enzyme
MKNLLCCAILFLALPLYSQTAPAAAAPAATPSTQALPAPARTGGMSLNDALQHRRSVRNFTAVPLTMEEISQLLWAAQGVTGEHGQRTAPSARARYYLHVYVAKADGFFEYLPATHALAKLGGTDVRAVLSEQQSVKDAPVTFLIAGDYERAIKEWGDLGGRRFVDLEAGHATQNLLLEAVALGLGGVPAGGADPVETARAVKATRLPADIVPIYLVPVGHGK